MTASKDYATPVLLFAAFIFFVAAAATPFASISGSGASGSYYFFQTCATLGDLTECRAITPSSDFGCTNAKNLQLGGQAFIVLTLLACVAAIVPASARLCGKCTDANRTALIIIHALMLVFGLVFTAVAFAYFFSDICNIGVPVSSVGNSGPCAALAVVGELLAIAATVVGRKYFSGASGTEYTQY